MSNDELKIIEDILDLMGSKTDPYRYDSYEVATIHELMDEICEKYGIEKLED